MRGSTLRGDHAPNRPYASEHVRGGSTALPAVIDFAPVCLRVRDPGERVDRVREVRDTQRHRVREVRDLERHRLGRPCQRTVAVGVGVATTVRHPTAL